MHFPGLSRRLTPMLYIRGRTPPRVFSIPAGRHGKKRWIPFATITGLAAVLAHLIQGTTRRRIWESSRATTERQENMAAAIWKLWLGSACSVHYLFCCYWECYSDRS